MRAWIVANEALLPWLLGLSVASFVLVLIAVPFVVVRLPASYFARPRRSRSPFTHRHPLVWIPLLVVKNVIALGFIVLGIAMLVLPGQGIVTMIVGLLILDFPGKYRAERWVIQRRWIHVLFNRIRLRAGREPFVLDEEPP